MKKTVELLKNLQNKSINTVINTSCSLLHIPYTLKNEVKLSDTYKKTFFSYASEKLVELNEIKKIIETEDYCNLPEYTANIKLFFRRKKRLQYKCKKEKVNALSEKEIFTRLPVFFGA